MRGSFSVYEKYSSSVSPCGRYISVNRSPHCLHITSVGDRTSVGAPSRIINSSPRTVFPLPGAATICIFPSARCLLLLSSIFCWYDRNSPRSLSSFNCFIINMLTLLRKIRYHPIRVVSKTYENIFVFAYYNQKQKILLENHYCVIVYIIHLFWANPHQCFCKLLQFNIIFEIIDYHYTLIWLYHYWAFVNL